ncbi:lactosylceramide alpha-2,3-sialyltransferase isoform X1 [Electrophorus electricus]|uniref:Lactosylceramide alpha-2,3-sialyltransferase n=1 Tax=Electrophorus electricus TaxID=8005 RepID=A0A4W4HPH8_ELEEL|nr:lactosylceramide alpha-2,3-sialyltransferase isoform X1 [Electrophorus electricus]XP_035387894.1 lactosylceramide alpha-2,3-sialyltransferase isoform X1 [Electrophorus electricus]XP_035387895.1 lactosylceramide alpha-2,3-sialyltransferase isoform X1 [Electrophorus electricus]XP_035387896.1 lactosylceramide alpha-2,3-sialyltransferase isoform X1 [Electrophorus electricus]XP_035387897.1 lactosylceramide alpha-2,3-sialyltransferase isoform X1 [Electrophorus electricus]XP_035387898.1 lactosylce
MTTGQLIGPIGAIFIHRSRPAPMKPINKNACTLNAAIRYPTILFVLFLVIILISIGLLILLLADTNQKHGVKFADHSQRQRVHNYVRSVLARECRPSFARKNIEMMFPSSTPVAEPFLQKNSNLTEQMFRYPLPFGLLDIQPKIKNILNIIPISSSEKTGRHGCRRCVVVGNGAILRGLELGPLLNQFNVILRLNSGPVKEFSRDVGNRTTFRMSYPEGSPKIWEDVDPQLQFVAVMYKSVDFNWLHAMITGTKVSFWDKLFFWQKVPGHIPVAQSKIRILNPEIIRQSALDLLDFPKPKQRLWGWDQNIPTIGMTAVNLATYLCDEISLAGFGYNLSQKDSPLHYYDTVSMTAMLKETMHNVMREKTVLQRMIEAGSVSDLTGGVHCSFC